MPSRPLEKHAQGFPTWSSPSKRRSVEAGCTGYLTTRVPAGALDYASAASPSSIRSPVHPLQAKYTTPAAYDTLESDMDRHRLDWSYLSHSTR